MKIRIGDEYITKNAHDAFGKYILTITLVGEKKIGFVVQDMKYNKEGVAEFSRRPDTTQKRWIEEHCQKIVRKR